MVYPTYNCSTSIPLILNFTLFVGEVRALFVVVLEDARYFHWVVKCEFLKSCPRRDILLNLCDETYRVYEKLYFHALHYPNR